jgi:hypothetical protein
MQRILVFKRLSQRLNDMAYTLEEMIHVNTKPVTSLALLLAHV